VQLTNRAGRLKPGMYAHVELKSADARDSWYRPTPYSTPGPSRSCHRAGRRLFQPQHVKIAAVSATPLKSSRVEGRRSGGDRRKLLPRLGESASRLAPGIRGLCPPDLDRRLSLDSDHLPHDPESPKVGDNQLEATVTDAQGKPIDDAEVTVQFFMPAMPTMTCRR